MSLKPKNVLHHPITARVLAGQDLSWQAPSGHRQRLRIAPPWSPFWKMARPARRRSIHAPSLRAHFGHDFDRTGTPADRCLTGGFRGRTLTFAPPISGHLAIVEIIGPRATYLIAVEFGI